MKVVNFDIIMSELGQNVNGKLFQARPMTDGGRSYAAYPMRWAIPELLGTTPFEDVYAGAPDRDDGNDFVRALRKVRGGFADEATLNRVGTGLYDALPFPVRDLFNQARGRVADDPDKLLRVRLWFDTPALTTLPWEYMKVDDQTFICRSRKPKVTLVRAPDAPEDAPNRPTLPQVAGQIRILVWRAVPADEPISNYTVPSGDGGPQDPGKIQQKRLSEAVSEILGADEAVGAPAPSPVDIFEEPYTSTMIQKLQNRLVKGKYQVLHYIGHGDFSGAKGVLLNEGNGGTVAIAANQLENPLQACPDLQVVFLNACDTAASDGAHPYSSLGLTLARYIPAVIAMQYPVSDDAAITFAQTFYSQFTQGVQFEDAILDARTALITPDETIDWGIPIVYTRAQ